MKKLIKALIWIMVVGGLSYLGYKQLEKNKAKIEQEAKMTQERNSIIPVVTGIVGTAMWEGKYESIGTFSPYKQVVVMSEAAGKVTQLGFSNGDYVKKGATLLSVDNDLLKIQLKTANNNLQKAQSDYKRLANLLGDGGITQQQLDDAKLAIDNLDTQVESIEKQISMTEVKAPISGVISNKMIEQGSLVAPSMQICSITNIDRLKLQVYLTEEQVIDVKKGQKVSLRADILPDQIIEGKIVFIDVNAGMAKRYLVEIEIVNSNQNLKAGMTGTAYFDGGANRELLAVPRESIVGNLQDAKIYVVEEEKAVLRSIQTGNIFGDWVQVRNGLSAGEKIVLSGQINLEDGMDITVANKE